VRYYFWIEQGVWCVPHRLHAGVVLGKTARRSLASSRQRIVEAYVRRHCLVEARGLFHSFDAGGYLDISGATEAIMTGY